MAKNIETQVKEFRKKYTSLQGASIGAYNVLKRTFFHPKKTSKFPYIITDFRVATIGNLYTFEYKNPKTADILEYYNTRPVILLVKTWYCENTKNLLFDGINVNFLPPEIRIVVLDTVYRQFFRRYLSQGTKIFPEAITENEEGMYHLLKYLLNALLKSGFEFAYRRYIFDLTEKIQHVFLPYWKCVAIYDTSNSDVVGASPYEIYNLYWDYRRKIANKS